MTRYIELPTGELLRADTITAIRKGDPVPADQHMKRAIGPRVIVDFCTGEHGNCAMLYCDTIDRRDLLAARLRKELLGLRAPFRPFRERYAGRVRKHGRRLD